MSRCQVCGHRHGGDSSWPCVVCQYQFLRVLAAMTGKPDWWKEAA